MATKTYMLGNREHQNRSNTFREHGNTGKLLLGTREHETPPPHSPPGGPQPWNTTRKKK